jgi:thiol-disulfide isomerase/thioredoxin
VSTVKTHRSLRLVRLLIAGALLLPVAARSQPALDTVLRNFEANGESQLVVDATPVPTAEIFKNSKIPAVLVISTALPSPVLLMPGSRGVQAVSLSKIARQEDGTVALLADADLRSLGEYRVDKFGVVAFPYDARRVTLVANPPLLGLHSSSDLLQHDPAYARNAAAYRPRAAAIATLAAATAPVTVHVIFGSWCPHCRQHAPYALAIEQALAGSQVTFDYYGLPQPPAAWADPEAKKFGVSGVPTAIVYVGGKKVGRLVGDDWNAPEVALARIVAGAPK